MLCMRIIQPRGKNIMTTDNSVSLQQLKFFKQLFIQTNRSMLKLINLKHSRLIREWQI